MAAFGMRPNFVALTWRSVMCLSAAGLLVHVLTMPPPAPATGIVPPPSGAGAVAQDAPPQGGEETFPAIARAPLFYPSREPWKPPPSPPPAPAVEPVTPPTGYTLIGVVVSGNDRRALIKSQKDERTLIVREGQALDGWTLKAITRERLRFVLDTHEFTLAFPAPAEAGR